MPTTTIGSAALPPGVLPGGAAPLSGPPSTTQTVYERGLDTPEAAAKNLWDAWRDDDRPRALLAATESAVNALFAEPWGPEVDDQGCTPVVMNSLYRCAFVQGNAARLLQVSVLGGRYRVESVERIGDLATSNGPLVASRPGPVGGPTTAPKVRPTTAGTPGTKKSSKGSSDTSAADSGGGSAAQDTSAAPATKQRAAATVEPAPADPAPAPVDPAPEPTAPARVQARAAETSAA